MYNFKKEVINVGVYNEGGLLPALKDLYEMYIQINKNLQKVWANQYCLIKDDLIKGVSGDTWKMLMIIDIMERDFFEVKTVYSPKNMPGQLWVMVINHNYDKPKDQYDFIEFFKKLQESLKKELSFNVGDRVNHSKYGPGIILEDNEGLCRDSEVIFKSDTNLGIPKIDVNSPRSGWTHYETTDIVSIKDLTKVTE